MGTRAIATILVTAVTALLGSAAGAEMRPAAFADLHDREGRNIGRVALRETPTGVLVSINLLGAAPGPHALHIHSVGRCERPDFESAGDHFNPDQRQHGFDAPNGPHAGDLPNLYVPETGQLEVEMLAPDLRLSDESPDALLDADGAAVVMHAGRDDQVSQPGGNAGLRLACGVVHRPPASSW